MEQQVSTLPLANGAFAVTVTEGETTTHHRAVLGNEFLEQVGLVDPDGEQVVTETMAYLLEKLPGAGVPHEIDLDRLVHDDPDLAPELRARLS